MAITRITVLRELISNSNKHQNEVSHENSFRQQPRVFADLHTRRRVGHFKRESANTRLFIDCWL